MCHHCSCRREYLLGFYNLILYFSVCRQIDKMKYINLRIRDENSLYLPLSLSTYFMRTSVYFCDCTVVCIWILSVLTCQATESFFTLVSFVLCSLFIFLRPVRFKETMKKINLSNNIQQLKVPTFYNQGTIQTPCSCSVLPCVYFLPFDPLQCSPVSVIRDAACTSHH